MAVQINLPDSRTRPSSTPGARSRLSIRKGNRRLELDFSPTANTDDRAQAAQECSLHRVWFARIVVRTGAVCRSAFMAGDAHAAIDQPLNVVVGVGVALIHVLASCKRVSDEWSKVYLENFGQVPSVAAYDATDWQIRLTLHLSDLIRKKKFAREVLDGQDRDNSSGAQLCAVVRFNGLGESPLCSGFDHGQSPMRGQATLNDGVLPGVSLL